MNAHQGKDATCDVRCWDGGLATSSAGRRLSSTPDMVASEGSLIMRRARRAGSVATAALIVAVMASCASDDTTPLPTPSTSPAPTLTSPVPTTHTATPTPPSDSEVAAEAATALLRTYFATVDRVRQDPQRPASDLDAVASSSQLTAQKGLLENQRVDGLRQLGDTRVIEVSVESVNLDDPATAVVDVCWDVSAVDIIDESDKSVVSPERKDLGWTRFTVTNTTWASAPTDGWRVSGGSDLEKAPCAGS